jgi:hypothetical protein
MDRTDAASILDELLAGFPFTDLDVAARSAWAEAIEDTADQPGNAREIGRRWCRTHERFPTLAEFLNVITPYTPPPVDPDELRVPPVVSRRIFGVWREALSVVDKKAAAIGDHRATGGHWHGGPDPCPMCGGKPPMTIRRIGVL